MRSELHLYLLHVCPSYWVINKHDTISTALLIPSLVYGAQKMLFSNSHGTFLNRFHSRYRICWWKMYIYTKIQLLLKKTTKLVFHNNKTSFNQTWNIFWYRNASNFLVYLNILSTWKLSSGEKRYMIFSMYIIHFGWIHLYSYSCIPIWRYEINIKNSMFVYFHHHKLE